VIAQLRYFYEEQQDLYIIAAGLLLEFALQDFQYSMPIGRIGYLHLGPLFFNMFLYVLGEIKILE
jgi:uncharacterized protein